MSMKRLFISQPMRGKTNEEIKEERNHIISYVKESHGDVEVLDSFFENAPHDAKPLWFLGKSFEILSNADIVVFAKGWREFRGCKMEYEAVRAYMPDVVFFDMDIMD